MNILKSDIFINMLVSASNNLENKKEEINRLNVFPVPDGDTGTNMSLTFSKATKEICNMQDSTVSEIAAKLSSASLRGARGNSGVILSQFIRGISKGFNEKEEINTEVLANAFLSGTESAYRAVMKPTEGTILTVMRGLSDEAMAVYPECDSIIEFFNRVIINGNKVLSETPELLPKLKQAGVVDSGGMGLMVILEGMKYFLENNEIMPLIESREQPEESAAGQYVENITFGYCTEYIIEKEHRGAENLKDKLKQIGDCVVVVEDEEIVKVHVHTDDPDKAIGFGLKIGQLINIKIDNMRHENEELKKKEEERLKKEKTKYGFVSVAAGDGFKSIFEELGIKGIISGGQSMNPSTDDILKKAKEVNAETVFVFPNNKNIILAAEQAKDLFEGELIVIPTTSMAQVFSVMMVYDESLSKEELTEGFNEILSTVKCGQVTYAVRDSMVNDIEIKEGDIMQLVNDKVVDVSPSVFEGIIETVKKIADEDTEIITLYAGEDISDEALDEVVAKLEELYPACDITPYRGEQPIYYYIASAE